MRKSIKVRLAVSFIGITLLSLLSITAVNRLFLEKYYISRKADSLETVYKALNEQAFNDPEGRTHLQGLCIEKNISWVLVDVSSQDWTIIANDGRNPDLLATRLLFGYIWGMMPENREVISANDSYTLEQNTDDKENVVYLDMWGVMENRNCAFLIRMPMASIRDSVEISNMFYVYIGLLVIMISSGIIWFMSKRITKPLLELTEISRRMSNLDFEARYEGGGEDEIGILGQNFNKMSEELEHTISELKTANNELQEDIEQKKQIDEMRKEFLSNVSHELKTPIALIQGYAEGLKECINDDAESREFYCDVIMDESAKMNNMVKKLLTLNQLEFGNDQTAMERFDLTDLVRGVVQSAQLLADQKGAQISFPQDEPVYVWGDEFKVEEVVTNYVSNALNHVDGDMKIEVKMRSRDNHVRLSVFNTGRPIPEEDLDKIWIKFYKVDKARTREYGGSGIGLSIVKAIMEGMHQKFGVVNYDNGVEFWFELEEK